MIEIDFDTDKVITTEDTSKSLLQHSLDAKIPHMNVCGGRGKCSTCRVMVLDNPENLSHRTPEEEKLTSLKGFEKNIRLACQSYPKGNVKVRRLILDNLDVQNALHEKGSTTGKDVKAAILFSDMRGFTTFSESSLPYDSVHILNRYFQIMGEAVLRNNGYLDKYIGDGLMAIFGIQETNNPCLQAVNAALEMFEALGEFNAYTSTRFGTEFKIGIGIHFGSVVVGNLGHSSKMQFTAIGDVVNTASRIESTTKKAGAKLLVSSEVFEEVQEFVDRGRVFEAPLKGKAGTHRLYEILKVRSEYTKPLGERLRKFLKQNLKIEDASIILRLVFHDGGTKDVVSGKYGLNGSIRFPEEYNREENSGLERAVKIVEGFQLTFQNETASRVSFSDCLAFAGAVAVEKAGGPRIFLETGRIDSDAPDPSSMLPAEDLSFDNLFSMFQRMGLTIKDLVALSGAHTLGFAKKVAFTANPFVFDNSYYQRILQGDSDSFALLKKIKY